MKSLITGSAGFIGAALAQRLLERGDTVIWCAGALARDYAQLGGRTLIAGKPHRPIYDAALAAAE